MKKERFISYKDSGVDIERGDKFVSLIQKQVRGIGGFSGEIRIPKKYKNPVLYASTDGVGTKLLVAREMKKHNTIGIDLVAMVVNDIIVYGAEPLFFLDYFATGKLTLKQGEEIMEGILAGCEIAGCKLVGGETAEMPGLYREGDYDLAGFGVGVVEKGQEITGRNIKEGDIILGLASSGIHSNGFSLARKVLLEKIKFSLNKKHPQLGMSIGEELLKPTKIYVKTILSLKKKFEIKGIAHITGSGIPGNLPRILPRGLTAGIIKGTWEIPEIFNLIRKSGPVDEEEMFNTFNMGIGMILIVSPDIAQKVLGTCLKLEERCFEIGRIVRGKEQVVFIS